MILFFYNIIYTIIKSNSILNRLEIENLKGESRYRAVGENIKGFLESPIGGNGISEARGEAEAYIDTCTSIYFLNVFGIMGIIYSIYWIYAICNLKKINFLARSVFIVIMLVILNVQPHKQILLTWCLLFVLLKESKRKIKDENKK